MLLLSAQNILSEEISRSNIVCFVRFADETEEDVFTDHDFAHYATLFNGAEPGANTVYNYFRQASYGKMSWTSVLFPGANGVKIVSYRAQNERGFYQQKSSINTQGYEEDDATVKAARERGLVKEIVAHLAANLPSDAVIDANGDGLVDNLTIVLSGSSDISNKYLLWPKRVDIVSAADDFMIHGKKVVGYILTFDRSNGFDMLRNIPINTGVLCHEMSHSLGTYDLYHADGNLNPVGVWDLMSDNQETAQNMTVYTKWRYCKWLEEEYGTAGIPEIAVPGVYTLNPVGGSTADNIAYKIRPVGRDEYFVLEYRKKEGFDANLPESGIIIYRINPNQSGGNVGYNGTTRLDEQYVFRPGGTTTADGDISKAAFSAESGRTAFGGFADIKPFYSDGTPANFAIANITSAGETISFELLASSKTLLVSDTVVALKGQKNSAVSISVACNDNWRISGVPEWLNVTPTNGDAGATVTVAITAASDNNTGDVRTATLNISSTDDATLSKTVVVSQEVLSQSILLADGFEDVSNPIGWVMENIGEAGSGWQFSEGSTSGKLTKMTNSGTHAMTMKETYFEETHQEAVLTSPTFAGGVSLKFYSHTNGGNATPKTKPSYLVQVSSDGGSTWNTIFDVLSDYPRDAYGNTVKATSYTPIILDLSAYTSDNMKIRFYCCDATNDGLSYWWQIDDLEISGGSDTGISDATLQVDDCQRIKNTVVYNINGQRLESPRKGIVIVGGKKVMVK